MTISVTTTNDAQTLAEEILGPGITISNLSYIGTATSSGTFTGGDSAGIGIDEGIILTSGNANLAPGPNSSDGEGQSNGLPGDPDLDNLVPGFSTNDASILEFDFESETGDLFFKFVFASEEYNEFVGSPFDDVFGFFLDGENIAFIPETTTPVSVNNVNEGNNSEFFNNNDPSDGVPLFNIEYDGFTNVFTVEIIGLDPGTHNIKIAIADTDDFELDSAVFIEAGSLSSVPLISSNPVVTNPLNPINGTQGNDGLQGTFDDDSIEGLGGNDALEGLAGDDVLDGGSGTDTVTYEGDRAGVTVDLAAGIATDGFGDTDTLIDIENVIGSASADDITGDAGVNSLSGGDGKDTIAGGGGNDFINGGAGADSLTGGAGNDTFLYVNPTEGRDIINDFTSGQDTIMIVGAVFEADISGLNLNGGSPTVDQFFLGASATSADHRFGYDSATGEVLFDRDGVGGSAADVLATLTGAPTFDRTDIVVL